MDGLFEIMSDSTVNYEFIKTRISRMWPRWVSAFADVKNKWPKTLLNRRKLTVLVNFSHKLNAALLISLFSCLDLF